MDKDDAQNAEEWIRSCDDTVAKWDEIWECEEMLRVNKSLNEFTCVFMSSSTSC